MAKRLKFTAVVTAHERTDMLRHILGCLMYQTRPPSETLAYLSDVPHAEVEELREDFPYVVFTVMENENDWGHSKRDAGLAAARYPVIGWFNDDDDYDPTYLATMIAEIERGADVAYCAWSGAPVNCTFKLGSSTSGNFVVRTTLARTVGWRHRDYCADGHFINALADRKAVNIVKVWANLYTHNAHDRSTV